MNSFREQFGCDWLQYRNHLETSGIPVLASSKTPALSTLHPDTLSPETVPSPPPPEKESPQEVTEEVSVGLEPQEEEEMEEQGEEEEEEEKEQDEVEGELLVAVMVACWESEENLGSGWLIPCGGRASAWEGGVLVLLPAYRVSLMLSPQRNWNSIVPYWCVPWRGLRVCGARSAFSGLPRATCSRWNSKQLKPWNGSSSRVWRQQK